MTTIITTENRGCDALVEALQAEFGAVLAAQILEAEASDFLWDARRKERYLGQYINDEFGLLEAAGELSRIAVLSLLDGRWHVGTCLVDGEGRAAELLWKRRFDSIEAAEAAFNRAA